jgi:hypothetical protein
MYNVKSTLFYPGDSVRACLLWCCMRISPDMCLAICSMPNITVVIASISVNNLLTRMLASAMKKQTGLIKYYNYHE